MSETSPHDVLIVGGGVIGLAVGWRLRQRGLSVCVLERDAAPARQTSRVAAGMIAPVSEASPTEPALLTLGLASADMYPAFTGELESETGLSVGFRRCGSLFLARDGDEAAVLDRDLAFRERLGRPVTRLLPSEARRLEPALAPTLRLALDIPDDHAVDPRALTVALTRAFTRAGGELRTAVEVAALSVSHETVHGVRLDTGESLAAGQVVVAAGPWSGQIAGLPPTARVALRPVKGQIVTLSDPAGPGLIDRVLRMQPGYLVPRGDGRYILGASVEERGFDTSITAGAIFALLSDAIELVPGAAEWRIDELNAGIRPGTADNLPIIGPSPVLDRLLWATGHHRHGVLLTPLTAAIVVAAILGETPPEGAEAATPGRASVSAAAPAGGAAEAAETAAALAAGPGVEG
ncbi:glycine oxidase ThiO [Conexibacter sp. DBS9H8]|uniref:glycine oxidase ThiO n=1 Tax=Conexibacter sp. DBS9H8 TaxID=2937801 RepID=UPI00200C7624|nr:glycine oxidase ThiO [Conexibacter sp. DBS9H8]